MILPACTSRRVASASATHPPVIAAVRVPPSAWMTSQSTVIWRGPSARVSTAARRERPIGRWISCPRPPAARPERVCVERGNIAYSAVTQPLPLPSRNGGTFSSTDAVQMTCVSPKATSADPSA